MKKKKKKLKKNIKKMKKNMNKLKLNQKKKKMKAVINLKMMIIMIIRVGIAVKVRVNQLSQIIVRVKAVETVKKKEKFLKLNPKQL